MLELRRQAQSSVAADTAIDESVISTSTATATNSGIFQSVSDSTSVSVIPSTSISAGGSTGAGGTSKRRARKKDQQGSTRLMDGTARSMADIIQVVSHQSSLRAGQSIVQPLAAQAALPHPSQPSTSSAPAISHRPVVPVDANGNLTFSHVTAASQAAAAMRFEQDEQVAAQIAQEVRPQSTKKAYESKQQIFRQWCAAQGVE